MKNETFLFLFFLFLLRGGDMFAQLTVENGSALNMTPAQLLQQWLVGQGVVISNATYNGSSSVITTDQVGSFETIGNAILQLGLNSGVLMTSGKASIAVGPNNLTGAGTNTGEPGDPDLNIMTQPYLTEDKAVIEFDFIPQFDTIKFRYVFGSEEFYEWCNNSYNDAFGFFLSGPGITGPYSNNSVNIAIMPDGVTPVTINNLCADPSSNWVNPTYNPPGSGGLYFQYDGMTYVFTAWYVVQPCSTYHIKLAVADAGDGSLDSGVFLEKGSFSSAGLIVSNTFSNPKLGLVAVEGCSDANVTFTLAETQSTDFVVNYTILGSAVNCVDYNCILDSVIIPAGQLSASLMITPIVDVLTEGIETVVLAFESPSCTGPTMFYDTINIDDNTPLVVIASNDTTVCSGNPVTLKMTPSGGQYPYGYNWSNGGTQPLTTFIPPPGVNTYIATLYDGCFTFAHDTVIVIVDSLPLISNPTLVSGICSNDTTFIIPTSNVTTTIFSWTVTASSGNLSGFSPGIGDTIRQIISNSGTTIDTVFYHVTPVNNGCSGPIKKFKVAVYPLPGITFSPSTPSICSAQQTNIGLGSLVSGSTFSWTATASSPAVIGYSDGNGFLIAQTLTTPGIQVESVTYHIAPTANGCDGSVIDYTVIINPKPHLTNQPMAQTICSEKTTNINLTASCLNPTYTWTAMLVSGNVTGFSNGSGPVIAQTLTNLLTTTGQVQYTITPVAVPCIGNDTIYFVDVKPMPHLTNLLQSKAICNNGNTNITLESDVTGTLFTWICTPSSINLSGFSNNITPSGLLDQTLVNSGFTTETVTYHITPYANGCDGPVADFIVTVYPTPDLANIDRTDSICDSTFTSINLASNVAGTLFTWRTFGSSPLVNGYSNSTIPGTTINQRLENNGFVPQTATYRLLPKANGCSGDSIDFVVTVFPTPDLSNPSLIKEICNNNNTNISLATNVLGTLFTWTCSPGSVNITGYSNSITPQTLISQNLINTGDIPETVTYHITPHANGCAGWVYHYVVTVIPSPYLTNSPLRNTQCNNQNTNLTLTSNVAGTQFNWTATASSLALTGYSNSVTPGTLISQTLGNTGFNVDSVTYHVTPVTSGCPGSVTDYNVVVFPTPDVYFNPNGETICEGVASGISNQSHVAGTTYSWTATASSPNLTGYYDSNGNMIAQMISNSGTTVESVTYHVTPQANGCPPGIAQNVELTVMPRPVISNATTIFQICNNNSISIFLQADIHSSSFAWRAFGSSGNLGGFSGGSGASIIQSLTNTGYTIESVTFRVAATAYGCPGDSTDFIVTVFPVPDVYFTPNGQTICSGNGINLLLQSNISGSSFTWTATGSSLLVSGYSPGSGSVIQQTLDNLGSNIETVTYNVSPTANGCPGMNNNVLVTVDPAPVVTFALCVDPVTTTDAQPIKLKGGNPVNGIYTGRGVSGATLFPALAGVGTDTIYYSFINTYGCSRNSYLVLSIISPLPFICGNIMTDPRDNKQYLTVQIGTQCWMAENLDYGTEIPSNQHQRDNCINEKYINPASSIQNQASAYQWDELMKYDITGASQGYCPPGWHIPAENEWNILFNNFLGNGFAGNPLKTSGYSGFNALLDGARFMNASWNFSNFATLFWSSTSHGPNKAWAHGMNTDNPSVSFYPSARSNAFPVRCLKD